MPRSYRPVIRLILCVILCGLAECGGRQAEEVAQEAPAPAPQHTLSADQTHNKFSRAIPPVLTVPSGAVIEAYTEEATDRQLSVTSTAADLARRRSVVIGRRLAWFLISKLLQNSKVFFHNSLKLL